MSNLVSLWGWANARKVNIITSYGGQFTLSTRWWYFSTRWWYLLYSPTDAAPQFLKKLTPFINEFSFGFKTPDKKRSICHCWVNDEADGKKRQELKELLVPDIIKFLFNRLPRAAILTEFQKLYEQNQDHIWERQKKIPTHHSIGEKDIFYFYVLFTRLPLTHQRGIEMDNVY